MDNHPVSSQLVGLFFQVDGKQLGQQYKDFLSDFSSWEQKDHAEDWMLFQANTGTSPSIDETVLSNGELDKVLKGTASDGLKGIYYPASEFFDGLSVTHRIAENLRAKKFVTETVPTTGLQPGWFWRAM